MKTPRQHNEKHLQFIRGLPCIICGDNTSTEAAHVRMACRGLGKRKTGMGEKPDDLWTVPLCGRHHREQHQFGEETFWHAWDENPFVKCLALWAATGDHERGCQIISYANQDADQGASQQKSVAQP